MITVNVIQNHGIPIMKPILTEMVVSIILLTTMMMEMELTMIMMLAQNH